MSDSVTHTISVDVEEYFQVSAFADVISPASWDRWPSRIIVNTHRVLDLFDVYQIKATFFVVGWIAQRVPSLVRDIASRGHEIGCHSYWHRPVYQLRPEQFRSDTRDARRAIEDAAGVRTLGYRAPDWSIGKRCLWALDILAEEGFEYDTSVLPAGNGATRFPYTHQCSNGMLLQEFPPTTFRFAGIQMRGGGGAYLRVLPMFYTHWVFSQIEQKGAPVNLYFHPWELDMEHPRVEANLKSQVRHYTNIRRMEGRLRFLFETFRFRSFRDALLAGTVLEKPAAALGKHVEA